MIGQNLNQRYTVTARIGKGGMGTVYRASDSHSRREVALKVISSELAFDPDILERFKREGQALGKLRHPNIVEFLDAFQHDEQYVIVMEYVSGGSLHDMIKKGPLPIERARQIALGLCDALIRSHGLNIIHRDIKPENVLMDEDGAPKLADFGVARLSEGTRMTRTGTKVGTPYYMAPEAWKGETINAQADIWSLGVVMFEMLAGQVPFDGDSEFTVMAKVTTTSPPDLKKLRKDAPRDLVQIVSRMLKRDKSERYKTMRQVAVDLENEEPITPSKSAKPAQSTRVIKQKTKIDFSRYRNFFVFGVIIIGVLVAINFLPSLDIPNQPTAQNTQIVISSPTNTNVPLADISIQVTPTPGLGSTIIGEDGMALVFVPAGEFTMGSDDGDSDERPVHQVYLDAFWIDQNEISNEMYSKCVDDGGCNLPLATTRFSDSIYTIYPVVNVDWNKAYAYCSWVNRRLPTEAEWEKAARGVDGRNYPWGEDISCDKTNFGDCVGDTSPVKSYPKGISPYGAYDMAGNVWEWVSSLYLPYRYNAIDGREELSFTGDHTLRGGAWDSGVRSSDRSYIQIFFPNEDSKRWGYNQITSISYTSIGFRCALSVSP